MEIKTKFDAGDEVFFLSSDGVKEGIVQTVMVNQDKDSGKQIFITYMIRNWTGEYKESRLFASKEDLIKSL